ncbi:hypothetical protein [Mycobacteroides chelonae]|uniref:hypothetical protein n=1 Tax=Mycobacteroides chelonae TaxID=1774 RepID=UPI0018B0EC3E|nr:hypothetical protein [Mycobacteroides chelonae]MBF9328509.1 hypothetical protein [Mycobacteroides chelonae]MBF9422687.1 hypothetical protein [Mycobacteroides chelonae]
MGETATLLALLQRHYIKPSQPLPGGVFLHEVGGNGSWGASGRADALYIGFTSSSGRILIGHELKVSRADWLNELNKPGKADQWADQCHAWYLVVSDPAIVKDGELPPGWGLMSPGRSKTRMTIHTTATVKPNHTPSWDAMRSIVARYDTLRAQAISGALADAHQAASAEVNERVESRIRSELAQAANNGQLVEVTRTRLRALEKALGHNINWDDNAAGFLNQTTLSEIEQIRQVLTETNSIKAAVRRLSGVGHRYNLDDLQRAVDSMRNALNGLDEAAS